MAPAQQAGAILFSMNQIKVRALRTHDYDQKPRTAGEEYEVEERFVEVLRWTGNIEVIQEDRHSRRIYKRRDMKAAN